MGNQVTRALLLCGSAVFIVGIVAGFAGMLMRWPDLSLIAIGNLVIGGLMAVTGIVLTVIEERREPRTTR